jgi:hypothetical protein
MNIELEISKPTIIEAETLYFTFLSVETKYSSAMLPAKASARARGATLVAVSPKKEKNTYTNAI